MSHFIERFFSKSFMNTQFSTIEFHEQLTTNVGSSVLLQRNDK